MRYSLIVLALVLAAGCSPWKRYDSARARVAVDFPGEPVEEGLRLNTPLGYVDALRVTGAEGEVRFTATVAELPADLLRRAGVKGLIQGQQQLEISGKPDKIIDVAWDADQLGQRFVYLREGGTAAGCYYLVRGTRLVMLSVDGPYAEARGARAAKFFGSLEVAP